MLLLPWFTAGCSSISQAPAFTAEEQLERGVRAYYEGRYGAAEQDLIAVTERVPQDAMAWFRLGNLYFRQHNYDRAAEAYQQALVRQSSLHKAWHNLGVVQLRLAQRHFRQLDNRLPVSDPMKIRAGHFDRAIGEMLDQQPAIDTDFGAEAAVPEAERDDEE